MMHRPHIRLHPELTTGRPFRNDGLLHAVIALLLRVWPRRNHSTAEIAAIERIRLDHLDTTIVQLHDMDAVARDVMLITEAGNLPLPHTFAIQNSERPAWEAAPGYFTLHAIDVDARVALVSTMEPGGHGKWIHTDDLARILRDCHYKPGDITFALIEQIQRGKQ